MSRLYRYVGSVDPSTLSLSGGMVIESAATLSMLPNAEADGFVYTYVIDDQENLRLAPRRSEHVACARAGEVFAAGEIQLERSSETWDVLRISNQSTGYCPDVSCWTTVERVLRQLGFAVPDGFDPEVVFRRCTACAQINIVKDQWYYCGACDQPLPDDWNF